MSAFTLLCPLALLGACSQGPRAHDANEAAAPPRTPSAAESPESTRSPQAKPATNSATPAEPDEPDEPAPERAALRADLELLCAALNHDYVDGTLTDYYKDARPKTALGERLRREGDESTQPGRALAAAYLEHIAKHAAETPGPDMPECARLFEELDDLE